MRIKVEKNKAFMLKDEIYNLLEIDTNKNYKFLPEFNRILNLLENIFKNLEDEEYYLRYENNYKKIFVFETKDGIEIHRTEITYVEIK